MVNIHYYSLFSNAEAISLLPRGTRKNEAEIKKRSFLTDHLAVWR